MLFALNKPPFASFDILSTTTAISSAVVKAEPFVKFKVPCVIAALFANAPFKVKVPVPPIVPSLLEPVFAVKVALFVNVPSLSRTAFAVALLINVAPEVIFKLV